MSDEAKEGLKLRELLAELRYSYGDASQNEQVIAADLIEELKGENKSQAKRIEELEDLVPHPGDGSCDRCGCVPSVDIPTALCTECLDLLTSTESLQTENAKLKEENAGLREKVDRARESLETAFSEDIDLAEGTANIRLALEALGETK